jgi:hypothetical protein
MQALPPMLFPVLPKLITLDCAFNELKELPEDIHQAW